LKSTIRNAIVSKGQAIGKPGIQTHNKERPSTHLQPDRVDLGMENGSIAAVISDLGSDCEPGR